jgi:hypothetical protein
VTFAVSDAAIRSISQVGDDSFRVETADGDVLDYQFHNLPKSINSESPPQESKSNRKCALCGKNILEIYRYVWPVKFRRGRIVEFDREHFVEKVDSYSCDECGKFKVFPWEVKHSENIIVSYYAFGEFIVRYMLNGLPYTRFAINDMEGAAMLAAETTEPKFVVYLVDKLGRTDMVNITDIARNPQKCGILYEAMKSAGPDGQEGTYIAPTRALGSLK